MSNDFTISRHCVLSKWLSKFGFFLFTGENVWLHTCWSSYDVD